MRKDPEESKHVLERKKKNEEQVEIEFRRISGGEVIRIGMDGSQMV